MATKEYITEKAFEVFMNRGYDSTSITVLQKELGMSRGAMYRHFESKEELFIKVVDKYIFGLLDNVIRGVEIDDDTTLIEMIRKYLFLMEVLYMTIGEIAGLKTKILNYTALLIQAAKIYPDFSMNMKKRHDHMIGSWEKAIKNSIERGEVRPDVEVKTMACIFLNSMRNMEFDNQNTLIKEVKNIRHNMMYIYSLIKQ